MRAWMVASLLLAAGCGGASSTASSQDDSSGDEAPAAAVADPTEGGRRRATDGEDCDFGGAADRTCQVGLYCCYGPPDDPGEHGRCMAECPEY